MGQTKRSRSKQSKINSGNNNFYPELKKSAHAIGKYIAVPGSWWDNCPAADKDKVYKCMVVDFVAMHDFGNYKGSGYKVCGLCPSFARHRRSLSAHRR